jgi:hypothetical protein
LACLECRKEALRHMFKLVALTTLVNILSSFVSGYLVKLIIDGKSFDTASVRIYNVLTKNPGRTVAIIRRLLTVDLLIITYAIIAIINSVLGTLSLFRK